MGPSNMKDGEGDMVNLGTRRQVKCERITESRSIIRAVVKRGTEFVSVFFGSCDRGPRLVSSFSFSSI
jgi:hypothetical protein